MEGLQGDEWTWMIEISGEKVVGDSERGTSGRNASSPNRRCRKGRVFNWDWFGQSHLVVGIGHILASVIGFTVKKTSMSILQLVHHCESEVIIDVVLVTCYAAWRCEITNSTGVMRDTGMRQFGPEW